MVREGCSCLRHFVDSELECNDCEVYSTSIQHAQPSLATPCGSNLTNTTEVTWRGSGEGGAGRSCWGLPGKAEARRHDGSLDAPLSGASLLSLIRGSLSTEFANEASVFLN
uniref:Uncharacterized protein n=1 Tax=Sphaerodactylus townsendi TaxID=933632 RepID=A0ACB8FC31_9SAUR